MDEPTELTPEAPAVSESMDEATVATQDHAGPDPSVPPVLSSPPAPSEQRCVQYVLASGPHMGESVECVLMGHGRVNEATGELRTNLALPESPTVPFQTWALYSESCELGTWR